MYKREIMADVITRLNNIPALAILGSRQVGKTTLSYEIAEYMPSVYLDLENGEDLQKLKNPKHYLNIHKDKLVIIDEVQRCPDLFMSLRGIIDEGRRSGKGNGRFLILGSASQELLRQSSESLAGRINYLELYGLNTFEVNAEDMGQIQKLWIRGGFPESYTASSSIDSYEWRKNFIKTYIERDIPQLSSNIPAITLERLWKMLAHTQGEILNASKIASSLGISSVTVGRYLDIMVELFLVRRLEPWHGNIGKRLVKSPRVYVRDSGILHTLLQIIDADQLFGNMIVGKSWEGFVIENIICALQFSGIKPFFYRTSAGAEIDLLLEVNVDEYWAIEIKANNAPKIKKGFHVACEDLKVKRKFVLYQGNDIFPYDYDTTVISLPLFIQEIKSRFIDVRTSDTEMRINLRARYKPVLNELLMGSNIPLNQVLKKIDSLKMKFPNTSREGIIISPKDDKLDNKIKPNRTFWTEIYPITNLALHISEQENIDKSKIEINFCSQSPDKKEVRSDGKIYFTGDSIREITVQCTQAINPDDMRRRNYLERAESDTIHSYDTDIDLKECKKCLLHDNMSCKQLNKLLKLLQLGYQDVLARIQHKIRYYSPKPDKKEVILKLLERLKWYLSFIWCKGSDNLNCTQEEFFPFEEALHNLQPEDKEKIMDRFFCFNSNDFNKLSITLGIYDIPKGIDHLEFLVNNITKEDIDNICKNDLCHSAALEHEDIKKGIIEKIKYAYKNKVEKLSKDLQGIPDKNHWLIITVSDLQNRDEEWKVKSDDIHPIINSVNEEFPRCKVFDRVLVWSCNGDNSKFIYDG